LKIQTFVREIDATLLVLLEVRDTKEATAEAGGTKLG
jgi:hypothetical protein